MFFFSLFLKQLNIARMHFFNDTKKYIAFPVNIRLIQEQ